MPNADFAAEIAAVARITSVPVILKIVKQITGMRFAAVARVTDQHWVTCATDDSLAFGLKPGDHLPLESTICHEIRQHLQPVVFGDVGASEFCDHHTPQIYGLQSYVSIPIVLKDGKFFGTLCAIDSVPVELDPEDVVSKLALFSELIASNLELQSTLEASNHALIAANEDASLQDEFVAVLSHDLRTPLSAIQMSADFLHRKLDDQKERGYASTILKSAERMGEMIENVLDFARGRLGGGIPIKPAFAPDLEPALQNVVDEIRAAHPATVIEQNIHVPGAVYCDVGRVCQLLSNLLANAVTHGSKEHPVTVRAELDGASLNVSVHNYGEPISLALMPKLFQPFKRRAVSQRSDGLGLGLYIARQIVEAHGGKLLARSNDEAGTVLTATLPIHPSEQDPL